MRIYITIPQSEQEASNQWMKENVDREGGENTFTTPFVVDGKQVYITSMSVTGEQLARIRERFAVGETMPEVENTLAAYTE